MILKNRTFLNIFVVFYSILLPNALDAMYIIRCRSCTYPICQMEPPLFCLYGEYVDNCGRTRCAKGPGERCGGPSNVLGECGSGMLCHDDSRCHGCSMHTLNCHS